MTADRGIERFLAGPCPWSAVTGSIFLYPAIFIKVIIGLLPCKGDFRAMRRGRYKNVTAFPCQLRLGHANAHSVQKYMWRLEVSSFVRPPSDSTDVNPVPPPSASPSSPVVTACCSMPPSSPLVQLQALTKTYREGDQDRTVLEDLSLSLHRGAFSVLMGRSGAGKSTLLNLISGIDLPTAGHVRIGDTDLTTLSETERTTFRRANIGFVFQSFNLISTLTAGAVGGDAAGGARAGPRPAGACGHCRPGPGLSRSALGRRTAAGGSGARAGPRAGPGAGR